MLGSNFCDTTCEIITSLNGASIFKASSALILFDKELAHLPVPCSVAVILECDVYDMLLLIFCYHIFLSASVMLLYNSS
jgi:hypothetical protein